jgi:hypothetical protein
MAYELCRVFDYDAATNSGACYSVFGDLSQSFDLAATEYRARPFAATPAT